MIPISAKETTPSDAVIASQQEFREVLRQCQSDTFFESLFRKYIANISVDLPADKSAFTDEEWSQLQRLVYESSVI
jgi:hypothetical protein